MGCCYCKYLDENNKKEGGCCGALYYCKKKKKYVNGSYNACDNFSKDYGKSTFTINEIYTDGEKFYDDTKDAGDYLIILIIMIILAIIVNLFS